MPLPLILVGAAALVAGAFGAKKGTDAYSDNKAAASLRLDATAKFDKAKCQLERAKEKCNSELESLGRLRLEIFDNEIRRFVSLFSEFRDVRISDLHQLEAIGIQKESLEEMRTQSHAASEVLQIGIASIGSGALVGLASYGATTMLASASTGTVISTLSGVAATNATLAWFGGGSLAAGGLGMAGGAAVLGGIVAVPVLAVGGMMLAAKARENLANARQSLAEAERAASEMKNAQVVLETITAVSVQFQDVSRRLCDRFTPVLDKLERMIEEKRKWWWRWLPWKLRINLRKLPESDQREVHYAWLFAQTLKAVLDTSLLTEEGALQENVEQALDDTRNFVRYGAAESATTTGGVALLEQNEDDGA